jgi:hypothetical protein
MVGGLSECWDVVAMHSRVRVSERPAHTVRDAEALKRVVGEGGKVVDGENERRGLQTDGGLQYAVGR